MLKDFFLLLITIFCSLSGTWAQQHIPDDPFFPRQWHLLNSGQSGGNSGSDIGIMDAWKVTTGGTNLMGDSIVICLIDNGIATRHLDLKESIWKNKHEVPDNQQDDDDNGYVDDHIGWNVYYDTCLVEGGKHGTPLAGIMAAKGNNGIGITGINWDVKIMTVVGGFLDEKTVLKAYTYPLEMRSLYNSYQGKKGAYVVVINASWGRRNLKARDFPDWCGIYNTLGEAGILTVASVANDRIDVDAVGDMPASCTSPFLITVTNSNHQDSHVRHAAFGTYGVDLAAPGENVFSVKGSGGYDLTGGASAAAPQVSGAIALLYSAPLPGLMKLQAENPPMAALQVKDWIMRSVDQLPQFEGITVSGGRLNVGRAIRLAMQEDSCLSCPAPQGLQVEKGEKEDFVLSWYSQAADSVELTFLYDGVSREIAISGEIKWVTTELPEDKEIEIKMMASCKDQKSRLSTFRINTKEF